MAPWPSFCTPGTLSSGKLCSGGSCIHGPAAWSTRSKSRRKGWRLTCSTTRRLRWSPSPLGTGLWGQLQLASLPRRCGWLAGGPPLGMTRLCHSVPVQEAQMRQRNQLRWCWRKHLSAGYLVLATHLRNLPGPHRLGTTVLRIRYTHWPRFLVEGFEYKQSTAWLLPVRFLKYLCMHDWVGVRGTRPLLVLGWLPLLFAVPVGHTLRGSVVSVRRASWHSQADCLRAAICTCRNVFQTTAPHGPDSQAAACATPAVLLLCGRAASHAG